MTENADRPTIFFWLIAVAALVWNGMGAMNFSMQLTLEGIASLPPKYQELVHHRPGWATAAFGIGSVASVLGALAMLLRRSWAVGLFFVAFICVLITLLPTAPFQMASPAYSLGENILTVLMPIVISLLLVWYSNKCKEKGWLR